MILVTGGTGLVGSHLLYKLIEKGEKVRAIHRKNSNLNTVLTVFSYFSKNAKDVFNKIEWVEADITNIPSLSKTFKGVITVYHAAAFISFNPKKYNILKKINTEGTANIVNLCIENKVKKLCYVSYIATLGEEINEKHITEETHWNAEKENNVYAITKYGAEMEVWRGTQEGVDAVIVNPGVILGAGFWNTGSGKIFKTVNNGLKYYTLGQMGFVDVEDVVKAMIQLMESTIKNERYILVSENWSYKDLTTTIASQMGVTPPKKEAKSISLQFLWRLDWLKHKLTGSKRKLTKLSVKSLTTKYYYNNEKIKKALHFSFKPLAETITFVTSKWNR